MSNDAKDLLQEFISETVGELWQLPTRPDLETDCVLRFSLVFKQLIKVDFPTPLLPEKSVVLFFIKSDIFEISFL